MKGAHGGSAPREPRVQQQPIEVATREAGVGERELHGLDGEADEAPVVDLALLGLPEPRNRGPTLQRHRVVLSEAAIWVNSHRAIAMFFVD